MSYNIIHAMPLQAVAQDSLYPLRCLHAVPLTHCPPRERSNCFDTTYAVPQVRVRMSYSTHTPPNHRGGLL